MLTISLTLAAIAYVLLCCFTVTMRKSKKHEDTFLIDCVFETFQLPFRALRFFLEKKFDGKRSAGALYEHLCGPRVVTVKNIREKTSAWYSSLDA